MLIYDPDVNFSIIFLKSRLERSWEVLELFQPCQYIINYNEFRTFRFSFPDINNAKYLFPFDSLIFT